MLICVLNYVVLLSIRSSDFLRFETSTDGFNTTTEPLEETSTDGFKTSTGPLEDTTTAVYVFFLDIAYTGAGARIQDA